MKHTKKRALLSAVAMLIVSVVVLSSATYAWFIAGTTANISGLSANVSSGSSVQVSPTGVDGSFTNSLNKNSFKDPSNIPNYYSGDYFPDQLSAVSTTGPVLADNTFFSGSLSNDNSFSAAQIAPAAIGASVVKYNVWVQSSKQGDVTLAGSTMTGGCESMVYAAIMLDDTNSSIKIYAGDGLKSGYEGIKTAVGTLLATDTGDRIIQSGEISASSGTLATVGNTQLSGNVNTYTIHFDNPNDVHKLTVWMWLEGQDPQCVGSQSATPALNLQFNAPGA